MPQADRYNYQNTLCNYWRKWIIRLKLIWCKGSQLIEKEIYELTGLDSIKSGAQKPDAIQRVLDFYNKIGIADKAAGVRQKQMKEIELLFDHYVQLLKTEGDGYESVLKQAYVTGFSYMHFLSQIQKAEKEVNRAALQSFANNEDIKEDYAEIISKIETAVETLREQEVKKIFHP